MSFQEIFLGFFILTTSLSFLVGLISSFKNKNIPKKNGKIVKVGEYMSDSNMESPNKTEIISEQKEPIKQRFVKYLSEDKWYFHQGEGFINSRVSSNSGDIFSLHISIDEKNGYITIYVTSSQIILKNKRDAMAEFVTRVNWEINIGNLELDMDEGKLQYKLSFIIGKHIDLLADDIINKLIWKPVENLDYIYHTIMRINYSNESNIDIKLLVKELLDKTD